MAAQPHPYAAAWQPWDERYEQHLNPSATADRLRPVVAGVGDPGGRHGLSEHQGPLHPVRGAGGSAKAMR